MEQTLVRLDGELEANKQAIRELEKQQVLTDSMEEELEVRLTRGY